MVFETFEGFKKIKNSTDLNIDQVYKILKEYEKEIGDLKISEDLVDTIIINVNNNSLINLKIKNDNIIIERKTNSNEINESNPFEVGKALNIAHTDRVIEQIFDLLNDYIQNNGKVSEHITSAQKVLYMEEINRNVLNTTFSLGSIFKIKDESGKEIYTSKPNNINKSYILKNVETKMEEYCLKYDKADENQFMIIKPPFEKIDIFQAQNAVKTIFKSKNSNYNLEISADYTDNHYLIEENEIVIGAIDCLDPIIKNKYRLEVNNLSKQSLIIIIGIMLDIYNLKNNNELGVQ